MLKTRIIQTFNTKVTNEDIRLSGEEERQRRQNPRSQIEAPAYPGGLRGPVTDRRYHHRARQRQPDRDRNTLRRRLRTYGYSEGPERVCRLAFI